MRFSGPRAFVACDGVAWVTPGKIVEGRRKEVRCVDCTCKIDDQAEKIGVRQMIIEACGWTDMGCGRSFLGS